MKKSIVSKELPFLIELTEQETKTISGGMVGGPIFTTSFTNQYVAKTYAFGAALGATNLLKGKPSAQASYASIINSIGRFVR